MSLKCSNIFFLYFQAFCLNVQNLRKFLLPILIYYTIVLTDYVLILREIIGIMSIKAGELYDKNSNS